MVGSIYQTENYSNVKISLLANGVNDYFKVEYPDGSSAYYGFSTDSKVGLLTYALTYWENPQAIRITYTYTQTNNVNYISSIKYGSVGTATPINLVNFVYKNRTRIEQSYGPSGINMINDKILDQINIKGNGVAYRNYILTHDLMLNYERLIKITEKNGAGTLSYNPTVFSYADNSTTNQISSFIEPSFVNFTSDGNGYVNFKPEFSANGDFDGDGDLDLLYESKLYTNIKDDSTIPTIDDWQYFEPNYQFPVNNNQQRWPLYSIGKRIDSQGKLMKNDSWLKFNDGTNAYPPLNYNTLSIYSKNLTTNTIQLDYVKQINRITTDNTSYETNKVYTGDFNGDGRIDIMNFQSIGSYSNSCHLFLVNLDRNVTSNYVKDTGIISIPYSSNINRIKIADVNGDGKSDIILIWGDSLNKIEVYTLDNNDTLIKLWETPVAFQHPGSSELFTEIIASSTSGHYEDQYVYANYVELNPPIIQIIHMFVPDVLGTKYNYPVIIGDYNGDGKADIMLPGLERLVLISTGSSFVNEQFPSNFPLPHDMGSVMGSDFNNDGKTDILSINSGTNGSYSINFFDRINVNSWSSSSNSYSVYNPALPALQTKLCPFMIKASKLYPNKPQVVMFLYTPSGADWTYKKIGFYTNQNALTPSNKLINKITVGNGVSEKITYANLSDGNGIYTSAGQIENYPNVDISNSLGTNVVSQIEKTSSTVYKKQLYQYYGGTSNVEGLGFLGFRSILKTNWFADASQIISNVTNYSISKLDTQHNFSFRGAPLESYSVLGLTTLGTPFNSSNPFVNWTLYGYNYDSMLDDFSNPLSANKVFKLRMTSTQTTDGLQDNNTVIVATEYDGYNNPTKRTTAITNDASVESINTVENYTYDNLPTATPYFIGRAKSKVVTKTIQPSNDVVTEEELYTYDKNLLIQTQKKATNSGVTTDPVTEINAYDAYGNIITKTLKATLETDRISSFQYDTGTHRFLTKKIDIQLQATDYTYNLSTGLLLTESPPFTVGYPLTTTYTYDTWGKKISTKNYLGKIETYAYANTTDGVSKTTTGPSGENSSSILILDDLGRKNHEGTKAIDGNWSYTSTYYDINDKPILVSQPYFAGVDGLGTFDVWNEMQYDVYGRLIQSNSLSSNDSTGKQTVYSYNGLSATENDGQKVKVTTKNPYGKVVSVTETPTGIAPTTITYQYFSNGNLFKTSTSGADTTIEQDGWGRKITLIDPSAGTYKYTYNNFGETKSEEVVGKGTTTYTLDDYGKVTTKTIAGVLGGSTTTYTYDGTSKLITGMSFTDTTNNYTIDYTYGYDNYRRLNLSKESRTGFYEFQKDYTFDAYGRLDTEHFKAQDLATTKISEKYIKTKYQNGYKYQLYDMTSSTVVGTTKLWQTTTVNQQGKVLTGIMGNGVTVANTYDIYGFPTQIKHDKTTTNIMTLNTAFEPIHSNLLSRTSNLFGTWNETLSYDNSDRLTSYLDTNGIQTQSYNINGTIAANNIGDYAYSISGKPFTLSTITPAYPSAVYDYYNAREQNITYNLFKSPVSITENSKENIDFEYNAQNSRSAMYYGDQTTTKSARTMRKFYSADGSMEIKRNITNNANDFVTYIGGDGYTAPVVLKSDGTTKNYFYLHRDYQGSILAITNSTGVVVEKRLFDVWGSLIKYANNSGVTTVPTTATGLFLDRGYTGHEHLLGVGLINMNGRIYDNKLHRFLQPDNDLQDPSNSQNYNRYGYCMNNPTKYADPTGEDWGELFGYLFYTYITGAVANNGELNPIKWDYSNPGTYGGVMGIASSFTSVALTEAGNTYMDNYNNPPQRADYLSTYVNSPAESHSYTLSTQIMWDNINNEKNQEKYQHFESYSLVSNMWNSPMVRLFVPDKIGFSLSSSMTWLFGTNDSIDFNWITRGNDGSFLPYITSTTEAHMGLGTDSLIPTGDALFSPNIGWYNSLDMRQLREGEVADGLLGYSANVNVKAEFELAGSIGASVGFDKGLLQSSPTWYSLNAGIGIGSPNASINFGPSKTYAWHIFHFLNK